MSPLIDAAGYAGAAIGTAAIVPQVVRAYRLGVAGVSAATYQIALASGLMWVSYGFALGVWPQVPGNVLWAAACISILYRCWRAGQSLLSVVRVAVITLAAALTVVLFGGPTFLGWFGGALSVSLRLPQIRAAIVSPEIVGISSLAWAGTIFANLCWFIYAVGHRDPRILGASAISMTLSVVIVQIVAVRRRRLAVAVAA